MSDSHPTKKPFDGMVSILSSRRLKCFAND
jgi:hypothetical protein